MNTYTILDLVRSGLLIAPYENDGITTYTPNNTRLFILHNDGVHLVHTVKVNAIIVERNRIVQWADLTDFCHPYKGDELLIRDPKDNSLHPVVT